MMYSAYKLNKQGGPSWEKTGQRWSVPPAETQARMEAQDLWSLPPIGQAFCSCTEPSSALFKEQV